MALAMSGLGCPKLPLWLVVTVFCLLLLRPMASIDWLRLRITRWKGRPAHPESPFAPPRALPPPCPSKWGLRWPTSLAPTACKEGKGR